MSNCQKVLSSVPHSVIPKYRTTHLDNCSSFFFGLKWKIAPWGSRVQNPAACIITGNSYISRIILVLQRLHWPPARFHTNFKIFLPAFKAILNLTPPYLSDPLCFAIATSTPRLVCHSTVGSGATLFKSTLKLHLLSLPSMSVYSCTWSFLVCF